MIYESFKSDLLGNNTQIVPLVVLEKQISAEETVANNFVFHRLSTHHITIQGAYFTPLLADFPKITSKVDPLTKRYTISKVNLKIHNGLYNGKLLSEYEEDYSFLNQRVYIYYKTQNCTEIHSNAHKEDDPEWNISRHRFLEMYYLNADKSSFEINGCFKAFTGFIRKFQIEGEKISITVEDEIDPLRDEAKKYNITQFLSDTDKTTGTTGGGGGGSGGY